MGCWDDILRLNSRHYTVVAGYINYVARVEAVNELMTVMSSQLKLLLCLTMLFIAIFVVHKHASPSILQNCEFLDENTELETKFLAIYT